MYQQIDNIKQKTVQQERIYETNQAQIKQLAQQKQRVITKKQQLVETYHRIGGVYDSQDAQDKDNAIAIPQLVDTIYRVAQNSNVVFSAFMSKPEIDYKNFVIKQISLQSDAGFVDIAHFVAQLSTLRPLTSVGSIRLTARKNHTGLANEALKISMILQSSLVKKLSAIQMQSFDSIKDTIADTSDKSKQQRKGFVYQSTLSDPFRFHNFYTLLNEQRNGKVDEGSNTLESNSNNVANTKINAGTNTLSEEYLRDKERNTRLIQYKLSQLVFLGTITGKNRATAALIKTPKQTVVMVREGDVIGKNSGYISAINNNEIVIQEPIQKDGVWQSHKVYLKVNTKR